VGKKISTTGELREFLAETLVSVQEGKIEPDAARNITKMAAQINESFYSEIKIAKVLLEANQTNSVEKLGSLPLNK
jgi:hypothetical protein